MAGKKPNGMSSRRPNNTMRPAKKTAKPQIMKAKPASIYRPIKGGK